MHIKVGQKTQPFQIDLLVSQKLLLDSLLPKIFFLDSLTFKGLSMVICVQVLVCGWRGLWLAVAGGGRRWLAYAHLA